MLIFVVFNSPAWATGLPKALLLTGNGNAQKQHNFYPPWEHSFQNDMIVRILGGIVDIDTSHSLKELNNKNLMKYELIISNSIFLSPDSSQLAALSEFVSSGKSFLTLHSGLLSFLNWELYETFMGGIFIGGPSAEPERFKVYTTNMEFWGYPSYSFRNTFEHPISAVVDDFITSDELYFFQPSKKGIEVIARAENHPVMWWHSEGKGKVMSLTLGHDSVAKSSLGYQQLLRNGVKWLLGYPLSKGIKTSLISNRSNLYEPLFNLESLIKYSNKQELTYSIKATNKGVIKNAYIKNGNINVLLSDSIGTETILVEAQTATGYSTESPIELTVVEDGSGNIASYHGNSIVASSVENQGEFFQASNLLDGELTTRWSSYAVDSAEIIVDLIKEYPIKRIELYWDAAFAKKFQLHCSSDGKNWESIILKYKEDDSVDKIILHETNFRFLKLRCLEKAPNKWGYSLSDIQLFSEP